MASLGILLLNVGRGDCILLRFPDQSWGVIDCGERAHPYAPANQAAAFLNNEKPGDTAVRFLLATHPHEDHDGGIRQFLQLVARPVHAVYYSVERRSDPDSPSEKEDDSFSFVKEAQDRVQKGEIRECRPLKDGDIITLEPPIQGIKITVLGPLPDFLEKANSYVNIASHRDLANNLSIVLQIEYGHRLILLPGDVVRETCATLFSTFARRRLDVLKAPHHGSRHSIPPNDILSHSGQDRYVLVSAPTDSQDYPHRDFLSAFQGTGRGWRIRCTGLARPCIERQVPQTWPWAAGEGTYLWESLRRSLLSITGRPRLGPSEAHVECCLPNMVSIEEDGTITHSVQQRTCDPTEVSCTEA